MKTYTLLLASALFALPAVALADVQITEIAWMGIAGANGQYGEWLELYNNGNTDVNLAGWKIYKAGTTVLFTLTKTIPAGGYLVVERTTASLPDPLPNITDEAGPFGGSGLSNSGENLVLKDATGATVQTLSFANGWPAGDANTKETMQWNGSAWVSAPATPKAAFVAAAETTPATPAAPASSTPPSSQTSATPAQIPVTPGPAVAPTLPKAIPRISFTVPESIHRGTPGKYSAVVSLEYMNAERGKFLWNMGDGTLIEQTELAPVTYAYDYPGTYTIALSYYRFAHLKDPTLELAKSVVVFDPAIDLSVVDGGAALKLANTTARPIDLSGWNILADDRVFVMPRMSALAANGSITLPAGLWGLRAYSNASLKTPTGILVASVVPNASVPLTATEAKRIQSKSEASSAPHGKKQRHYKKHPLGEGVLPIAEAAANESSHEETPHARGRIYWLMGAAALALGTLFFLERLTARAE